MQNTTVISTQVTTVSATITATQQIPVSTITSTITESPSTITLMVKSLPISNGNVLDADFACQMTSTITVNQNNAQTNYTITVSIHIVHATSSSEFVSQNRSEGYPNFLRAAHFMPFFNIPGSSSNDMCNLITFAKFGRSTGTLPNSPRLLLTHPCPTIYDDDVMLAAEAPVYFILIKLARKLQQHQCKPYLCTQLRQRPRPRSRRRRP